MAENILITDQQARKQLAEDIAKLKANPINRTVKGGYFLGTDGKPHDAFGNPVEERSEKSIKAEVAETVKAEQAEAETPVEEASSRSRGTKK